jgi:hypothetical protein
VASWPDFHPKRLLRALVDGGVDFVVVGGVAVNARGYQRLTKDLDICYATTPENLEALGRVLVDLGARLKGVTEEVPFVPDARTLRRTQILTLDTSEGPLDVLAEPDGSPGYAVLRARAEDVEAFGVKVPIAAIDDLIAMKRAAGRPLDLVDVQALEAVKRLSRPRRARRRPLSPPDAGP